MTHRNMALGRLSRTTPSISITSSLTFLTRSVLFFRSLPVSRASFFPNKMRVDKGDDDDNDTTDAVGDVTCGC